MVSYTAYLNII